MIAEFFDTWLACDRTYYAYIDNKRKRMQYKPLV